MSKSVKQLRVTLTKSLHGRVKGHAENVRGLGIRKIHQTVTVQDTPENRGMIKKVCYLLDVVEE